MKRYEIGPVKVTVVSMPIMDVIGCVAMVALFVAMIIAGIVHYS